jgi:hypothetical protein
LNFVLEFAADFLQNEQERVFGFATQMLGFFDLIHIQS